VKIVAKLVEKKEEGIISWPVPPPGISTVCKGCHTILKTDEGDNGDGKVVMKRDRGYSIPAWEYPCPICKRKVYFLFPVDREPFKTYFATINDLYIRKT
jgi:hypothetical protein